MAEQEQIINDAELNKKMAAAQKAKEDWEDAQKRAAIQRQKDLAKMNSDISDVDKKKALGAFPEIMKKLDAELQISISVTGKKYITNHAKTDLDILALQLNVLKSIKELAK